MHVAEVSEAAGRSRKAEEGLRGPPSGGATGGGGGAAGARPPLSINPPQGYSAGTSLEFTWICCCMIIAN